MGRNSSAQFDVGWPVSYAKSDKQRVGLLCSSAEAKRVIEKLNFRSLIQQTFNCSRKVISAFRYLMARLDSGFHIV